MKCRRVASQPCSSCTSDAGSLRFAKQNAAGDISPDTSAGICATLGRAACVREEDTDGPSGWRTPTPKTTSRPCSWS